MESHGPGDDGPIEDSYTLDKVVSQEDPQIMETAPKGVTREEKVRRKRMMMASQQLGISRIEARTKKTLWSYFRGRILKGLVPTNSRPHLYPSSALQHCGLLMVQC